MWVPVLYGQAPAESLRTDLYGDPLPAGAVARLGSIRLLDQDVVTRLAFLPGDKQLVAGASVWDVASGRETRRLPESLRAALAALAHDGKMIAAWQTGGWIHVIDVASGKVLHKLAGNGSVGRLAWSPDSRRLAAKVAQTIFLWDAETGNLVHRQSGVTQEMQVMVLARDGKLLAGGDRKGIQVWDLAAGQMCRLESAGLWDLFLAFAPDGKTLVGSCAEPLGKGATKVSLRQWDSATGKKVRDLHSGGCGAGAFSADGALLATAWSREIRLWDPASGKEIRKWPAHGDYVTSLAFSHDGKTLASGGRDQRVRLWDPASGKDLRPSAGHSAPITALAFAPDGNIVASGGADCSIRLWDWITGRELSCWDGVGYPGGTGGVRAISFAPDGKTLISAEANPTKETFRLWDVKTGKILSRFGRGVHASAVAFSPDNQTIVAAIQEDRTYGVIVWEPIQGKLLRRVGKPENWNTGLTALSLSPDGLKAAWIDAYKQDFGLLDMASGKTVFRKSSKDYSKTKLLVTASCVAFSPDGTLLATAETQGPVRLWESATGKLLAEWKEMTRVYEGAVAFSPDGRLLVAGNERGLGLWEVASQQEVKRFAATSRMASSVVYAPHGRVVVASNRDGTLLAWDVTGGLLRNGALATLKLTEEELEVHWKTLNGTDAAAQRAVWSLAAAAPASLALVKKHLSPVPLDIDKRVARLIGDLDDKTFAVRDKAMKELLQLGELAQPALRGAMAAELPLEMHRRLEQILRALDEKALAVKWLRTERALAVLDYAASPEARQHLEHLAAGSRNARLTTAAQAALRRLARSKQ